MGQVADEMNQLPTVLAATVIPARVIMFEITGKSRHPRESDAIFDNPEQLSIAQFLRCRFAQVRGLGIKSASDRRVPAAVVGMANRTVIREVQPRLALNLGRIQHRILCQPRVTWNRQMTRIARNKRFQVCRRGLCAQSVVQNGSENRNSDADKHEAEKNQECAASHGSQNALAGALFMHPAPFTRQTAIRLNALPSLCPPLRSKIHTVPDAP